MERDANDLTDGDTSTLQEGLTGRDHAQAEPPAGTEPGDVGQVDSAAEAFADPDAE